MIQNRAATTSKERKSSIEDKAIFAYSFRQKFVKDAPVITKTSPNAAGGDYQGKFQ